MADRATWPRDSAEAGRDDEIETRRFYEKAAERPQHPDTRQLLDDLASEERQHENRAQELEKEKLGSSKKKQDDEMSRRLFVLQITMDARSRYAG